MSQVENQEKSPWKGEALDPLFLVRWIGAISRRLTNGAIEPPDAVKLKAFCFPGIEPPKTSRKLNSFLFKTQNLKVSDCNQPDGSAVTVRPQPPLCPMLDRNLCL
jgi:hypothetical protein